MGTPLRNKGMSQETKEILSRIEKWKNVKLTGEDVEWLLHLRSLRKGSSRALKRDERQHLFRIRNKIVTAIEYLALTAKLLPEQQQEQVFTTENLKDFVEALLTNFERKKGKGIVENERVFHIAFMLAHKGINCGSDLVKYPAPYISQPLQFIYPEKARLLNFIDEVLRINAGRETKNPAEAQR